MLPKMLLQTGRLIPGCTDKQTSLKLNGYTVPSGEVTLVILIFASFLKKNRGQLLKKEFALPEANSFLKSKPHFGGVLLSSKKKGKLFPFAKMKEKRWCTQSP